MDRKLNMSMQQLTADGRRIVEDVAQRNGVSTDTVLTLLRALVASNGNQAQFNISELGGMGQWSRGGMTMVGDMFNNGLKYRVDTLCSELSGLIGGSSLFAPVTSQSQSQSQGQGGVSFFVGGGSGGRWPAELGNPSSAGSQNDLHYAVFPSTRRLAIEQGGHVSVYDTADHMITGFSQQQSGDQSLTFTSQYGLVRVADLVEVTSNAAPKAEVPSPAAPSPTPPEPKAVDAAAVSPVAQVSQQDPEPARPEASAVAKPQASVSEDDIFAKIERLADLRKKEILTAEEFEAKKTELLSRL